MRLCEVYSWESKVSEILSALDSYNKTVTELNNRVAEFQERLAEVEEICGTTGVILVSAGQCGENVFYALYSDGSLKLNGSGATYDYDTDNRSPFYNNATVKSIIISSGITGIGVRIFTACNNLKSTSLPGTVTSIGDSWCCTRSGTDYNTVKCNISRGICIP